MAQASVDRFGFLLSDVARLYRAAFEREIAKSGLGVTPGEARALVRIAAINGMRQSEIAVALGIEPMTLSRYIDGLEKAGLIERRVDPKDGRARCVSVTEKGAAVLAEIRTHTDDLVARLQADLPESDRQALFRALRTMRDNFARL